MKSVDRVVPMVLVISVASQYAKALLETLGDCDSTH